MFTSPYYFNINVVIQVERDWNMQIRKMSPQNKALWRWIDHFTSLIWLMIKIETNSWIENRLSLHIFVSKFTTNFNNLILIAMGNLMLFNVVRNIYLLSLNRPITIVCYLSFLFGLWHDHRISSGMQRLNRLNRFIFCFRQSPIWLQ